MGLSYEKGLFGGFGNMVCWLFYDHCDGQHYVEDGDHIIDDDDDAPGTLWHRQTDIIWRSHLS